MGEIVIEEVELVAPNLDYPRKQSIATFGTLQQKSAEEQLGLD